MEEERNKRIINKILKIIYIIFISLIIVCSIIIVAPVFKENQIVDLLPNNSKYSRIDDAIDLLKEKYNGEIDEEKIIEGAIKGAMSSAEDPYTRYLTEAEYKELDEAGTEEYIGIGVHITYDTKTNGILVLSVMPNSPALESGIEVGDIIHKVDNKVVSLETYNNCVDAIKGEEGNNVKLMIYRENKVIEKNVKRKKIVASNVTSEIKEGNIGYIKIVAFEHNVSEQFKQEYDKLLSKNISSLIIDVRNNPGGLLTEVISICDMLMPEGLIVKLIPKAGIEKTYMAIDNQEINIPLVVLTNGRSASASEILAGAIKDSQKGLIIGDKTFGKGIVQTIFKLDVGALSITTSKYYTSSGIEIHANGILPNIEVSQLEENKDKTFIPEKDDLQLKKAIEHLSN